MEEKVCESSSIEYISCFGPALSVRSFRHQHPYQLSIKHLNIQTSKHQNITSHTLPFRQQTVHHKQYVHTNKTLRQSDITTDRHKPIKTNQPTTTTMCFGSRKTTLEDPSEKYRPIEVKSQTSSYDDLKGHGTSKRKNRKSKRGGGSSSGGLFWGSGAGYSGGGWYGGGDGGGGGCSGGDGGGGGGGGGGGC